MKMLKRTLVVLAAVFMLVPMTAFAAKSPALNSMKRTTATAKSATYNGKSQKAKLTVKMGTKTLKEGKDFKVTSKTIKRKNAGTIEIKIKGIGKYTGTTTVKFTVKKAAQKLTVKKAPTIKYTKLKKKSQSFRLSVARKAQAKVTYSANNKKISVSKTGKVTLKKGLKKGTYKITVRTKATGNYKAATKTITVKVK